MDGLACFHFAFGEYNLSEQCLNQALEIVGKDCHMGAILCSNLTHVTIRKGNQNKAKELTEKAEQVIRGLYGDDYIFFAVLNGNHIVLENAIEKKAGWLKRTVLFKMRFWEEGHPNVFLSKSNFLSLLKHAFPEDPAADEHDLLDVMKVRSHAKYFGQFHPSILEICTAICFRYVYAGDDIKLLKWLKEIRNEFKIFRIFPLEADFKARLMKRRKNPDCLKLT